MSSHHVGGSAELALKVGRILYSKLSVGWPRCRIKAYLKKLYARFRGAPAQKRKAEAGPNAASGRRP